MISTNDLSLHVQLPANIYLFQFNNKNIKKGMKYVQS